jgi:hypothetical protein
MLKRIPHQRKLKDNQKHECCPPLRPDYSQIKPPERWTRTEALAVARTLRLKADEAQKHLANKILGSLLAYCEQKDCYTEVHEMLAVARKKFEVMSDAAMDADAEEDFDSILDGDGVRIQYETDHFTIDYTVDAGTLDQVQDPASDTVVAVTLADGTLIGTTTSGAGVPDFVKMMGIWLEYYLQQYVAYGFNDPTDDGAGGIAKLDVVVRAGGSSTGPGLPIGISNITASVVGLAGGYNAETEGLGVSPGHELFHQVQYTYNPGGAAFLRIYKEGTARWAEDSVNDAYNRYNKEIADYLPDPTVTLLSETWKYETVFLWKYLSEQKGANLTEPQRGVDSILLLWQNLVGGTIEEDGITAINNTVTALDAGSSVYDLFAKFSVAIYLKDLADPFADAAYEFLEDEEPRVPGGQVYASVVPYDTQALNGLSPDYLDTATSNAWGLHYYVFDLDSSIQSLNVAVTADPAFTTPFYCVLEIRSGTATVHEGSGASYTVDLLTDITDAVTPRIDQVVVIVGAYETGGIYDLTVSLNNCVPSIMLVIDHSGSMSAQGKMTAAIDAATLFVDLAEANGVPGLGAVGFSTIAAVLANANLEQLTATHAGDVRNSLAALAPTDLTSIGDGLQKAWDEFDGDPVAATREVIVLLSDGMENTDPLIDDVDDTLVANNITAYTVGLGEDYGIEPEKLEDLAVLTGGDYRMTGDPTILEEFYLQILADNLCADMDGGGESDPDTDTSASDADTDASAIVTNATLLRNTLNVSGRARFTTGRQIHVVHSDTRLNVVLTWNDANNDNSDLVVVAPGGLVINSANFASFRGVKYRRGIKYVFLTIDLPIAGRREGTWYGYASNAGSGAKIRAFMSSGLSIDANTTEKFLYTGETIDFTSRIIDRGRPVSGLKVTVTSDQPLYSYGNVMARDFSYATPPASGDPIPATQAKMNALLKQEGEGLLPRTVNSFSLKESAPGVFANSLFYASNPGSYHFTAKVEGLTPDGDYCVRYVAFTKVVRTSIDSQTSTFVLTPLKQRVNQFTLTFTPADKLGNLMGPGYGQVIKVRTTNAQVLSPIKDLNNGTYTIDVGVDPANLLTTGISIDVKNQVIAVPKQVLVAAVTPSPSPTFSGTQPTTVLWLALLALILAIIAIVIALVM